MATIDDVIAGLVAFRNTTYEKLDALSAKVDGLEQGQRLGMEFCDLCQGTGYYHRTPSPGAPDDTLPCYICDKRGWKVVRKDIDAEKLDAEFPQK